MASSAPTSNIKKNTFGRSVYGMMVAQNYFTAPFSSTNNILVDSGRFQKYHFRDRFRELVKENLDKNNTMQKMYECGDDIAGYVDLYRGVIYNAINTLNNETDENKYPSEKAQMATLMLLNSPEITTMPPSLRQTKENLKHGNLRDCLLSAIFFLTHKQPAKQKQEHHSEASYAPHLH